MKMITIGAQTLKNILVSYLNLKIPTKLTVFFIWTYQRMYTKITRVNVVLVSIDHRISGRTKWRAVHCVNDVNTDRNRFQYLSDINCTKYERPSHILPTFFPCSVWYNLQFTTMTQVHSISPTRTLPHRLRYRLS